jgi:hypothetical protein
MSQPDTSLYGRQIDDREIRALGLDQLRRVTVGRTPSMNVLLRLFDTQHDETPLASGAIVIDAGEVHEFVGDIYAHAGGDPLLALHRLLRPEVYGYQTDPRAWTPEVMSEVNEAIEQALRANGNPHARLGSEDPALPATVG